MLKDITIGQYYPGNSIIHKLDPRVKLMGTLVFIVTLFAFGSVGSYICATIALAIVITLSRVPLSFILRGLKAIFVLMVVLTQITIQNTYQTNTGIPISLPHPHDTEP